MTMKMDIDNDVSNQSENFGDPIDSYLKAAIKYSADKTADSALGAVDEIEISMRSYLLTKTDLLLKSSQPNEVDKSDSQSKLILNLVEYFQSCLRLCTYLLNHPETLYDPPNSNQLTTKPKFIRNIRQIPFLLLEDSFDTIPSSHIPLLWTEIVENKSTRQTLCGKLFFGDQCSKLIFIRTCNNLYKRLSSNIDFSGRILMLLAVVFPLSERSAANVTGKFNDEKKITIDEYGEWTRTKQIQEISSSNDSSLDNQNPTKLDYQFYKSFWGVQIYFSDPNSIIGKWNDFHKDINLILAAFEGNLFRDEHVRQLEKKWNKTLSQTCKIKDKIEDNIDTSNDMEIDSKESDQLARHHQYLTSSQLFHLQLRDPEIRIQFLTQLLIVCSHLNYHTQKNNETNMIRNSTTNIPAEILPLVESIQKRAEILLSNAPPNGKEHFERLMWTLENDETIWRKWKSQKCPSMEKNPLSPKTISFDIGLTQQKANPYIHTIHSLKEISLDLASHRPSDLKVYLEDYADAMDPEAGIEEEYHPKKNSAFCFRSLRLVKDSHNLYALSKVRKKDGDLEGVVREIWRKEKGIELPGEEDTEELSDEDDEENTTEEQKENESQENTDNKQGMDDSQEDDSSVDSPFLEDDKDLNQDATANTIVKKSTTSSENNNESQKESETENNVNSDMPIEITTDASKEVTMDTKMNDDTSKPPAANENVENKKSADGYDNNEQESEKNFKPLKEMSKSEKTPLSKSSEDIQSNETSTAKANTKAVNLEEIKTLKKKENITEKENKNTTEKEKKKEKEKEKKKTTEKEKEKENIAEKEKEKERKNTTEKKENTEIKNSGHGENIENKKTSIINEKEEINNDSMASKSNEKSKSPPPSQESNPTKSTKEEKEGDNLPTSKSEPLPLVNSPNTSNDQEVVMKENDESKSTMKIEDPETKPSSSKVISSKSTKEQPKEKESSSAPASKLPTRSTSTVSSTSSKVIKFNNYTRPTPASASSSQGSMNNSNAVTRKRNRNDHGIQANLSNRNNGNMENDYGGRIAEVDRMSRGGPYNNKGRRNHVRHPYRDNDMGRNDGRDGRGHLRDNHSRRGNIRSRQRGDIGRGDIGGRDTERGGADGDYNKNRRYTKRTRNN